MDFICIIVIDILEKYQSWNENIYICVHIYIYIEVCECIYINIVYLIYSSNILKSNWTRVLNHIGSLVSLLVGIIFVTIGVANTSESPSGHHLHHRNLSLFWAS